MNFGRCCIDAVSTRHELENLAHDEVDAASVDILHKLVGEHVKIFRRDVNLVSEVAEQLALHLVDLAQTEETLTHDGPALVRVDIVTTALASDQERRNEETVTR